MFVFAGGPPFCPRSCRVHETGRSDQSFTFLFPNLSSIALSARADPVSPPPAAKPVLDIRRPGFLSVFLFFFSIFYVCDRVRFVFSLARNRVDDCPVDEGGGTGFPRSRVVRWPSALNRLVAAQAFIIPRT